jgi:Domain of unknown function (DUF4124)
MRSRILASLALGWLALAATAADADVYKWVDDGGSTHYADSPYGVPERYRGRIVVVEQAEGSPTAADAMAQDPAPEQGLADPAFAGAGAKNAGIDPQASPSGDPGQGADPSELAALAQNGRFPVLDLARQFLANGGAAMIAAVVVGVLVALVLGLALSALVLGQACRWAGVEPPGFARAMAVVFVAGIASSAPGVLVGAVGAVTQDVGLVLALNGLSLVASLAIQVAVYRVMLTDSVGRAVVVWFLNLAIWIGVTLSLIAAGLLFSFC